MAYDPKTGVMIPNEYYQDVGDGWGTTHIRYPDGVGESKSYEPEGISGISETSETFLQELPSVGEMTELLSYYYGGF